LSWNQFNKIPFHTFYWEGIDGSKVITHFPPNDTYNSRATVKVRRRKEKERRRLLMCFNHQKMQDFLFNVSNFKDKDRSSHSLFVYGEGDGGGGPLPKVG
jgi:alpha-mannosidase